MASEHQIGVTRFELYGLLSSAYAFILFVHMSAGLSQDSTSDLGSLIAAAYRLVLTVLLATIPLLFTFLLLRERKRQSKKDEKAA